MFVTVLLRPEFWDYDHPYGIVECEYDSFKRQFTSCGYKIPLECIDSFVMYKSTGETVYIPIPEAFKGNIK
jgi:hypothetical protein